MPALIRQNAEVTPDTIPLPDDELRMRFTEWLTAYQQAASDNPTGTSAGSDTDSDRELPADDEFPDYLDSMQAYLEFIILQRDCAASRVRHGLPPAECSRGNPCRLCREHDGSYVTAVHWHVMSDADVERHMQEYLRIRDALPRWQSTRPVRLAPVTQRLVSIAHEEQVRAIERVMAAYWVQRFDASTRNVDDTGDWWGINLGAPSENDDDMPPLESPTEEMSPHASFEDARGMPALESPTEATSRAPHHPAHDFLRGRPINMRDLERELLELL